MQPEPAGLLARGKLQARPEIEQDIGGLRDDELARLQERRREGACLSLPFIIANILSMPALLRATSS